MPAAAALAEARGLPGIGVEAAHTLESRIALRRRLAEAGVPQPALRRGAHAARDAPRRRRGRLPGGAAAGRRGRAARQRPVESLDDVDAHLHQALAASRSGEAILEEFVRGVPLTAVVVARGAEAIPLTALRAAPLPAGRRRRPRDEAGRVTVHAVHALGLRDTVAVLQLTAHADGRVHPPVVRSCSRGRKSPTSSEAAVGIDLVDVRLRLALGDDLPDEVVRPRFSRPHALRFLTAGADGLPVGRVARVGPLDKVLAFPGVVRAEVHLAAGDTIDPRRRRAAPGTSWPPEARASRRSSGPRRPSGSSTSRSNEPRRRTGYGARMRRITVLVTASGAPGTAALLRALRENGEREVRLVGTDKSERSVGRHLCDAFHVVPPGARPGVPTGDA